jgi:hypothetical protein
VFNDLGGFSGVLSYFDKMLDDNFRLRCAGLGDSCLFGARVVAGRCNGTHGRETSQWGLLPRICGCSFVGVAAGRVSPLKV